MKEITVEQLLHMEDVVVIDVRSPGEFEEACIPGAVNIPVFTNEERKEVGTIYKQIGPAQAKWRGMEIFLPKVSQILDTIKKIEEGNKQPIFYCWRGGMRSGAMTTFVDFSGLSSIRLSGGYRAYRQYILEEIPQLIPNQAVVLHGMTGTGKTEILVELRKRGYPVLDLEEMAAHRGSLFGTLGFKHDGNNQKTFDGLLFESLRQMKESSYFIVEAESKRIGKVGQPDELYEKKLNGINLYLQSSLQTRTNRIYKEYFEPFLGELWFQEIFLEKVMMLKKRLKNDEIYHSLIEYTQNEQYHEVTQILLEYYYDPRYSYKLNEYKNDFTTINADNLELAIKEIETYIRKAGILKRESTLY
ncbi:tRNA 2-selenouridine(34) synthase MnmH [Bacillus sp. V3B]|uniref:tRNA 2-selenouridine(34) synthase MnmH n=1 Tax=Bacillus sp. V3B TaxID=2804915 RepID=UPI00210E7888|nr:tRNA 2-selenouridine(34) synthase MnmH [Bacillus sp. V3B]MCQ6276193.1 tRNA 2-selenouridine(34) synthase MnmH [Bacillus sp. V3B]